MDIWLLTLIFAFSSSLFSSPLTSDDICRDAMPPRRFLKLNEETAVTWLGAAQENKTHHLPQFWGNTAARWGHHHLSLCDPPLVTAENEPAEPPVLGWTHAEEKASLGREGKRDLEALPAIPALPSMLPAVAAAMLGFAKDTARRVTSATTDAQVTCMRTD
jgi:hypothetical protein